MLLPIPSFLDELAKIAAVRGPVKQYRRAAEGFTKAVRSISQSDIHLVPRAGFAAHGTDALPEILESGRLVASPLGETGQHGSGVYWWKGFPREDYLRGLQDEGVLSDLATLPNKRPPMRNIHSGGMKLQAQVTGPGDYALRPKDTAVVDMATRGQDKSLAPVLADAAQRRLRVMDTAMFHRARQQIVSNNQKKPLPSPTKTELVQRYKNRLAGDLT